MSVALATSCWGCRCSARRKSQGTKRKYRARVWMTEVPGKSAVADRVSDGADAEVVDGVLVREELEHLADPALIFF